MTRDLFLGAIRDPHFTGAHRWFQVADVLAAIRDPRYPYLVEGILEFMREMRMGPIDPFDPVELGSYRTWKSFERKVDALLERLEARIRDPQPIEHLQWEWMKYVSGKGVGWTWPTDRLPSQRSFWYYLGFLFDSTRWFIRLAADGEPEAVVAIGLWAEPTKAAALVKSILESKGMGVSAAGFQIIETDNGQGVVLLRRLRLVEVAHAPDHNAHIFEFFTESHRLLVDSGVLAAIAVAFRDHFAEAPVPLLGEDSPETQPV